MAPWYWDRLPPELHATDNNLRITDLPDGRDITWARVDLGVGAFSDPVRDAAEQAEFAVALAGFHGGEVRWRLLDGYLDFIDERLHSQSTFGPPDRMDDLVIPGYTDFMVTEFERLKPQLQQHLPIADPDLTEVVQAVRWWLQARRQTPLASLMLDVRVLDLMASRVGAPSWQKYLDLYLRTCTRSTNDSARSPSYEHGARQSPRIGHDRLNGSSASETP